MFHFLDIRGGMKSVSVHELPSQALRKQRAYGGFTGASRAHNNHDHGSLIRGNMLSLAQKKFGWETWTRTRIARFRVWSPTNWTISQPMGGKKGTAAESRGSGRPRFFLSNLIGIRWGVNRERKSLESNPLLPMLPRAPFGLCAW